MGLKSYLVSLFNEDSSKSTSNFFELSKSEEWWRDRFELLNSHGYRLRERLRPGWIPSWETNPRLQPEDGDDSAYNYHARVTHAVRSQDGSDVVIKKVSKRSNEKSIAIFLSSEQDENNRCVPIIDTFADEKDDDVEFIVMPLLRRFDSPPFYRVDEIIDFMRQTLRGIAFIHSKNVAHRDCSDLNITLDGTPLYPEGFHPIRHNIARDRRGLAKYRNRSDVKEVKYYFTDFGISMRFTSSDPKDRLVIGCRCQVDVPELSDYIPYDPFAVDMYLLGDVYRRHFTKKFVNARFLEPLMDLMVREDPSQRPDASRALRLLDELIASQSKYALRWKLIDVRLNNRSRFAVNLKCFASEAVLAAREIIRKGTGLSQLKLTPIFECCDPKRTCVAKS